jgi:hypothetical protein
MSLLTLLYRSEIWVKTSKNYGYIQTTDITFLRSVRDEAHESELKIKVYRKNTGHIS